MFLQQGAGFVERHPSVHTFSTTVVVWGILWRTRAHQLQAASDQSTNSGLAGDNHDVFSFHTLVLAHMALSSMELHGTWRKTVIFGAPRKMAMRDITRYPWRFLLSAQGLSPEFLPSAAEISDDSAWATKRRQHWHVEGS